ncbi:hypothetical protein I4U23_020046 [Adineta vaga]|nr:hypothetical protein I4U23_020046 [Adineta vaga]
MWNNGYSGFGGLQQRDLQSNNWFSQSYGNGLSNPFAPRFDNYLSGISNPFSGQTFGSSYQPFNSYGYQYRGF